MGKKIVFLGSDGSGKSSLINYIKDELKKEGKEFDIIFMGWRDFKNPILRIFSWLTEKKDGSGKSIGDKRLDRYRERGWSFYFAYYSELWLRYMRILFSRADFILFDRYFYDELMFSRGMKFRMLKLFTPKPDISIILRASEKELRKRGINFSKYKLDKFYDSLYKVERICRVIRIDSSRPIDLIYKDVKKVIK